MVSPLIMEQTPELPSFRVSTVVPATPRGDENGAFHLNKMDLLMKLHYIRAVYFFNTEAVQGLTVYDLKKPMFPVLDLYPHISGRIRVSESGRPFIKCNDAGVRIADAHCDKTVEEWLEQNWYSVDGLVHDHVLGPEIGFSPLVFVKFTWFKSGGLCVGFSWSHILGDAFSASNFITMWSKTLAGHVPPKSLHMPTPKQSKLPTNFENPLSMKKATTIEEHWLANNDTKLITRSFYVTSKQLDQLVTTSTNQTTNTSSYFELLSALVWKCISQIREDSNTKVVTICTHDNDPRENMFPTNGMLISIVEANVEVGETNLSNLVRLISEKKIIENHFMEKLADKSEGKEDFVVYGANLTFVDLEETNFYGVKLNGQKPILANCSFHGVGDKGVVLVLPAPEDNEDDGNGRMITVSLPKKELDQLKDKLGGEWGIVSHPF